MGISLKLLVVHSTEAKINYQCSVFKLLMKRFPEYQTRKQHAFKKVAPGRVFARRQIIFRAFDDIRSNGCKSVLTLNTKLAMIHYS